ncbi:phage major tail protein, TP901-1 family [Kordiimonas sp.]|uniref:phage major tail protein, TP901-1 family n=1 Tax=Kordiimonas sp. TaxID=1970157 RepID=UPI003A925EE4
MTAQLGKELLLKIHDGSAAFEDENFILVGGFTSNDMKISNQGVDITSKDSGGFKEMLEGGGVRSFTSSASGVFMSDAAFALCHGHMLAATHPECRVIVPGHGTYGGKFAIGSLELTGADEGEVSYSMTFESAGPITFA